MTLPQSDIALMANIRHLVFFSGAGSWAAAKRVVGQHGAGNVALLFTDVRMEDEDNYRFYRDAIPNIGCAFYSVSDGRTPWDVFFSKRFMGNSRLDPCSAELKRKTALAWVREHVKPETTLHVGIDWSEAHRFDDGEGKGIRNRWASFGYTCEAPMIERPYLGKIEILEWMRSEELEPPRLYAMGFQHANCGGFCVKGGQKAFAHLLRTMPERYAFHEAKEQEFRDFIGKNVSIMRDRRKGKTRPLTMREFRERVQAGQSIDEFDWGACGCFSGVAA